MPTAEEVVVAEQSGQGEGEAERVVQTLTTAPEATRKYKPRDSTAVYLPIYERLISELAEQLYGDDRYVHYWFTFGYLLWSQLLRDGITRNRRSPGNWSIIPVCVCARSCGPTRYSAAVRCRLWIHLNVVSGISCRPTRNSVSCMGIHFGSS
jgi:hypothetical protein